MKKFFKKYWVSIVAVLVTFFVTSTTTFIFTTAYHLKKVDEMKFDVVGGYLDTFYYGEYDKEKAMEYAVKGYVSSLGDPYTEYFTPLEYKSFQDYVESSYCGIGVSVKNETETNVIRVVEVFNDSPAKDVGIEADDIISKVNGVPYSGEQLDEAISNIKGEEGTYVKVTVIKHDTGEEKELDVERRNVVMETVESEIIDGNIGYIYISQFATNTAAEFAGSLDSLCEQGITSLIVDVRENPGGTTLAVEAVASCLLPEGAVIYYTSDKYENKEYFTSKMDGLDIPLVILANENSASASEILVGAIKDNGRGIFVGKKTFGKGVVQSIFELGDGSALKITMQRYYTPNGHYINEKGIEPDYAVELNSETDTQLEKAIEILKNQ